jgi:DNA adenine methylase
MSFMQLEMFEDARRSSPNTPVNVASVPQRSPFRYPGGKTWLVPQVRNWLRSIHPKAKNFIEPFAGGGIVSLTVAAEKLAGHVTMVELDEQVAAVWQTVIETEDGKWLAQRIMEFDINGITADEVRAFVEERSSSVREQAFKTILKNRTFHGGILAPGSSPIKSGENGKGLASRWYPETLRKRILGIVHMKESIQFIKGDGLAVMESHLDEPSAVFFIDPPYTVAGKGAGHRLYTRFELDHERLFEITNRVKGDFLMTYDNAPDVRELAARFGFDTKLIAMKNTHHAEMNELLIGRNLDWVR